MLVAAVVADVHDDHARAGTALPHAELPRTGFPFQVLELSQEVHQVIAAIDDGESGLDQLGVQQRAVGQVDEGQQAVVPVAAPEVERQVHRPGACPALHMRKRLRGQRLAHLRGIDAHQAHSLDGAHAARRVGDRNLEGVAVHVARDRRGRHQSQVRVLVALQAGHRDVVDDRPDGPLARGSRGTQDQQQQRQPGREPRDSPACTHDAASMVYRSRRRATMRRHDGKWLSARRQARAGHRFHLRHRRRAGARPGPGGRPRADQRPPPRSGRADDRSAARGRDRG